MHVLSKYIVFVCHFLLTGISVVNAQKDCIDEVQSIYTKMDIKELDKGFIYMNFTMIQHRKAAPSEMKTIKSEMEYVVGKKQMQYQTSDMKVFTDEADNFTIIPSRKIIFWSNSLTNQNKTTQAYQMLQKEMFSSCKLISCETESDKQKSYNKIVSMKPMVTAKKKYPYEKMTFYINTITQEIKKVEINYPSISDYSMIEIIYNKVQYNYQSNTMNLHSKDLVFSANGILKNEYKGFKVVDDRLKEKK